MRKRRLALERRVDDLSGYTQEELMTHLFLLFFGFAFAMGGEEGLIERESRCSWQPITYIESPPADLFHALDVTWYHGTRHATVLAGSVLAELIEWGVLPAYSAQWFITSLFSNPYTQRKGKINVPRLDRHLYTIQGLLSFQNCHDPLYVSQGIPDIATMPPHGMH